MKRPIRPKEKSEEIVREEFLNHIRGLVDYWDKVDEKNCREKLQGLAFSVLAMLDGVSTDICGFIVAPSTHEDDKAYHIANGEDYYPQNHRSNVK